MTEDQNCREPLPEIDLDRADPEFKDALSKLRGAEKVMRCYACGACSARCPVGDINPDFDPRRLIRMIVLGLKDEILESPLIWRCSTCFTCQETCPQGVGFTEVLFVLKNLAVRAGHFPPAMSMQPELLKQHGRLYEVGEFENEKRTELGLPALEEKPEHFCSILKEMKIKAGGKE